MVGYLGVGTERKSAVKQSPMDILKQRLAAGELSIEEFRRLREELGSENLGGSNGALSLPAGDSEQPLAEIDNVAAYEKYLTIAGEKFLYSEVVRANGTRDLHLFNYVPTERSASLFLGVSGRKPVFIYEDRVIFGGTRQGRIAKTSQELCRRSFHYRVRNLVDRLRLHGEIILVKPYLDAETPIVITADGYIKKGSRLLYLPSAASVGTLGIGWTLSAWFARSKIQNGDEIVISEHATVNGKIPRDALYFRPNAEDPDAVAAVIQAMVKSGETE